MKKNTEIPKEVYFDTSMHIVWNDGQHYSYPYWDLRTSCPCASCVNELTGERTLDVSKIDPNVAPKESEYVGNYALTIRWSDGHSTGMYTFSTLRNHFKKVVVSE